MLPLVSVPSNSDFLQTPTTTLFIFLKKCAITILLLDVQDFWCHDFFDKFDYSITAAWEEECAPQWLYYPSVDLKNIILDYSKIPKIETVFLRATCLAAYCWRGGGTGNKICSCPPSMCYLRRYIGRCFMPYIKRFYYYCKEDPFIYHPSHD